MSMPDSTAGQHGGRHDRHDLTHLRGAHHHRRAPRAVRCAVRFRPPRRPDERDHLRPVTAGCTSCRPIRSPPRASSTRTPASPTRCAGRHRARRSCSTARACSTRRVCATRAIAPTTRACRGRTRPARRSSRRRSPTAPCSGALPVSRAPDATSASSPHTDVAAYHVAGKNVFAAGVDPDGVAGVFVASNRGENRRTVATLDDPSTHITELVSDVSGQRLYIVHDHGSRSGSCTSVQFPGLAARHASSTRPTRSATSPSTTDQRATSPCRWATAPASRARRSHPVLGATEHRRRQLRSRQRFPPHPIGWLNSNQLVVAARHHRMHRPGRHLGGRLERQRCTGC